MMPGKYNLTAWEGQPFTFAGRWLAGGGVVDLTGWDCELVVTPRGEDDAPLLTVTATVNADGEITFEAAAEDLPTRGVYAYSLTATEPGNTPFLLLLGVFTVKDSADV